MPDMIGGLLESGLGISRHAIRSLLILPQEGELLVTSWDGGERIVPLTEVEPYTRRGCGSCDDYWGRSADVSVGSVGSATGFATVITNTTVGELIVQNARRLGMVEGQLAVDAEAVTAAQAAKSRRTRAVELDHLQILVLDALFDQQKRAEVKRQFAHLHDDARDDRRTKEGCDGYCDGC
jgi:coenzyme F420-reducing hydrogenase beta subunit